MKSESSDDALQKVSHALRERVKELDCLYAISNLLETPDISIEDIIRGTLEILPAAWQYPEVTCGRITLDNRAFRTRSFQETIWKLSSDIVVNDENMGTLEVFYKEERPRSHEGPFLREERKLIDAVAEKLGKIIWIKLAEKSLKESEENPRRRALGRMGICVACTNLAICRYPKSIQHPVMFCEEFSSSRANPRRKEISTEPALALTPVQAEVNEENFSNNYIGLCKRCDKLYACRLTKPGGGTWLCEFFEERRMTK